MRGDRRSDGSRFLARKYGLSAEEAGRLASHPDQTEIVRRVERWRDDHGLPAADSPLVRGVLLSELGPAGLRFELTRGEPTIADRVRRFAVGDKVFFDSFAGLVPAVVLALDPARGQVEIRVTARRGAYRAGEVDVVGANHVVKREWVRGGRIVEPPYRSR